MSRFTILGGNGFIGARLAATLACAGHEVWTPARDENLADRPLGHVIYAIGVTFDFRTRPFDTIAAHVCRLNDVLRECRFDGLVYLSSTRVYAGLSGNVDERSPLVVDPQRPDDLYNLSKLAGESLALACGRPTKVVRIANVYDGADTSDTFFASVLRAAASTGAVTLQGAPESAKDYIALDDVVAILPKIAIAAKRRVYNVSSGTNVSHAELARQLAASARCRVEFAPGAAAVISPTISNARLQAEFGFRPRRMLDDLPALVETCRACQEPSQC
jgi:nucleoside-diphosphate-sugar epimerase